MRIPIAALALAILLLDAGAATAQQRMDEAVPTPPPSDEPLVVQGERWAQQWIRELHHTSFDPKRVAADAAAAMQPNEPREMYFDRMRSAIAKAFYAFAPIGARHDDATRYRLPFELDSPRYMVQGPNGRFTHIGEQAFDFAMPVGTPVLAAREGVVARVRDGFRDGGLDPKLTYRANEVLIAHADGSFASYVHLSPGIPVREGQAVKQGERIASSGNIGFTAGPHLHFSVAVRSKPASVTSVPIRFGVGSRVGFVPVDGQFYGGQPKRTVELAVSAGGTPITDAAPLRMPPGSKTALQVLLTAPGGAPVDVTRSPSTRYFTPTGWSLVVDEAGAVKATPAADFAAAFAKLPPEQKPPGSIDWGVVVVTYKDAAQGHEGFASVPVLVRDAAAR